MYTRKETTFELTSQETIAFLDLTGGKEFNLAMVRQLPLVEVLAQIKADTGREIVIKNKMALASIGIVKYDLPVGYALFANKNIEKDQVLFNYGGVVKNRKPDSANSYCLEVDENFELDALREGDLGTLCMHLFDPIQLEGATKIVIDEAQYHQLQFHNLSRRIIHINRNIDFEFSAREFISQGSVLGFSYGFSYWLSRNTSPLLISKNSNVIKELSVSEPLICLRSWECNKGVGSIVFRKATVLAHFNEQQSKKLCVFWPPAAHLPSVYANKSTMRSFLEKSSYSSVFEFIKVKDISREIVTALQNGKKHIVLPLSIYAKPGQVGHFSDAYLSKNDKIDEEHEISQVFLPA